MKLKNYLLIVSVSIMIAISCNKDSVIFDNREVQELLKGKNENFKGLSNYELPLREYYNYLAK